VTSGKRVQLQGFVHAASNPQPSRKQNSSNSARYTQRKESPLQFTNPINTMVLTHRSTRAAATENQQELVAQRQATKLAPVTKNAEATTTMEDKQAAQEPPVSNTGVSRSRKGGETMRNKQPKNLQYLTREFLALEKRGG